MGDVILGIETSCDETAVAVVERGTLVRSSVVSSQVEQHARYGGVVPEVAGRAHVQQLVPVLAEALATAGIEGPDVDAVAAKYTPQMEAYVDALRAMICPTPDRITAQLVFTAIGKTWTVTEK